MEESQIFQTLLHLVCKLTIPNNKFLQNLDLIKLLKLNYLSH
jgi:hypothetical protein